MPLDSEHRIRPSRWREWAVPGVLVACMVLVGLWELLAHASRHPFKPFDLTAADFAGFRPGLAGWSTHMVPVSTNDPAEPNIVALEVRASGKDSLVRLVHGYNMPTCLRIKSYTVTLIADWRGDHKGAGVSYPTQVWRVTSRAGEVSVWASTMLRAGDFGAVDDDIRDMAFPRADGPDDPRWIPQGITRESLRHPLTSLRGWFRERWNSSRMDLLTFLRLRHAAWASDERLSYVVRSLAPPVSPTNEAAVIRQVLDVHHRALTSFQQWRRATLPSP